VLDIEGPDLVVVAHDPAMAPGQAGSAVHPRLVGGTNNAARISARPHPAAGTATSQRRAPRARRSGARCKVGLRRAVVPGRRQRLARNRAHRPTARAGEPAGPFSSKRRTLSGCASKPAVCVFSPAPYSRGIAGRPAPQKGMAGPSGPPSGEGFPLLTMATRAQTRHTGRSAQLMFYRHFGRENNERGLF